MCYCLCDININKVVAMKNLLEELWLEKINPYSYCKKRTNETDELEKFIERHKIELLSIMTKEQKITFEKFEDCYDELVEINERKIFTQAFKLGAQTMLCVLDKENY